MISGPSGAGKTSLVAALLRRRPDMQLSVSATTRAPRAGEVDGANYRFVEPPVFDAMIRDGEFLEWAEVHGSRYGTPRQAVEEALSAGRTVILEIDVQGAQQVRRAEPEAVTIFVLPPSVEVLAERLKRRATESDEAFELRMRNAAAELAEAEAFDHRVVNDDLDAAVDRVIRILEGTPRNEPDRDP